MPIPTPEHKESQSQFVNRCLSDGDMRRDYSDIKERFAICSYNWKKSKDKKEEDTQTNLTN